MTAWLRNNPLLAALGIAAVALAAIIVLESEFGSSPASVSKAGSARRAAPPDAKLLPPVTVAAAEQAYPETTARPLFTPTRRPAPDAPATPQSTFQKGQFVLQGVIVVGASRVAILREKSSGRLYRVEQGREVNGIKVAAIEPEVVTLAQGGEEEKVGLTVQKGPGVPGAPGVPGQPAPPPPPQAGPFAAPPPAGLPVAPPGQPAPGQPAPGLPVPHPGNVPPATPAAPPQPAGNIFNPAARSLNDASGAPLTPEELLARRRARRAQQTQ